MRSLLLIVPLLIVFDVSAQSPRARRLFNEATILANSGDFDRAFSSYLGALEESSAVPTDDEFLGRLHYNLGVCQYQLNHPERAIEEFHLAIKIMGGRYARAFYALGMAESARQNWPAARLAFLEALKRNNSNGEAWFDLAFVYLQESRFSEAETAFRKSIEYGSIDSVLSYNNIGVILAFRGDCSSARKEFEAALKSSGGNSGEAKHNLAYCRSVRDRPTGQLTEQLPR